MEQRPILIVDDDETILDAVRLILNDEGYAVAVAANGRQALALALELHPSLILLDMKMPVMDGWSFARAYRAAPGPHAPIIVMTAAQDSTSRAAEVSADAAIGKPFDIDQLIDIVRLFLA